jgi:hypothetical protein
MTTVIYILALPRRTPNGGIYFLGMYPAREIAEIDALIHPVYVYPCLLSLKFVNFT